ncbi:hypothetical protein LXT21_22125 [Myxococcus sp. K38C18041901]|uniref:hypothetical protein n=1 Tax=Myxococcus guangdongensis TaxID=2906760 RepID=UPI0020A7E946|nr:hypothetical protein [Myxococcus guangdongensis]MCP3061486.1 hypothetical protein [Myxococcus guangdongensis]
MDPATNQTAAKSGDLTVKQAGIGFLIVAAILGGVEWVSKSGLDGSEPQTWSVAGIPVAVIAGVLGVLGVALTLLGIIKKI